MPRSRNICPEGILCFEDMVGLLQAISQGVTSPICRVVSGLLVLTSYYIKGWMDSSLAVVLFAMVGHLT